MTNVSAHGFWLLLQSGELFVPFSQFPWFRDASIGQLLNVELPGEHHLYWPDLDVDLEVESIEHPERYPLISRERAQGCAQPAPEPARLVGGSGGAPRKRAMPGKTLAPRPARTR